MTLICGLKIFLIFFSQAPKKRRSLWLVVGRSLRGPFGGRFAAPSGPLRLRPTTSQRLLRFLGIGKRIFSKFLLMKIWFWSNLLRPGSDKSTGADPIKFLLIAKWFNVIPTGFAILDSLSKDIYAVHRMHNIHSTGKSLNDWTRSQYTKKTSYLLEKRHFHAI